MEVTIDDIRRSKELMDNNTGGDMILSGKQLNKILGEEKYKPQSLYFYDADTKDLKEVKE